MLLISTLTPNGGPVYFPLHPPVSHSPEDGNCSEKILEQLQQLSIIWAAKMCGQEYSQGDVCVLDSLPAVSS